MKDDERALFETLRKRMPSAYRSGVDWPVTDVFEEIGMHINRGYYILNKWSDRDWWEYGVNARWGWFTPNAPKADDLPSRRPAAPDAPEPPPEAA